MRRLPMKLLTLTGFLVLALFLFVSCTSKPAATPVSAPELETAARTFVDFLVESKFEEACGMFNEEMAAAMSPAELKATWDKLIGQIGAFREVTESKVTKEGGHKVVDVTCNFAEGPINIRVVFDKEEKVAGLWFRPV